ncbi:uncharacterized protein J8A68_004374 [[Candida] subhashii]|uniref:1,3-beta-glucanosyltransferase n=1 Tax=[Candida] subhashii TaxID=561895 RepID=A0A8J5QFQ1_9ASCO|nr:uncharacterized protein J8A68_004374 [[Candida] subhashii]KAG7662112.1 hypothetical protein J8A68_004374 [[Candida] subhashii]
MIIQLVFTLLSLITLINALTGNHSLEATYEEDVHTIQTIKVVGNKFFLSQTGEQFFIKGISYQKTRQEGEMYDNSKEPHYIDSMANPFSCLRDLEYLKELGVNLVRVYQILPTANHDVCMNAFAEAGIYVLADLSEPYLSIRRDFPHWDTQLLSRYQQVIDSMHKYDNVLGFFAGNEVTNSPMTTAASPFVRAAIRDSKAYIKKKGYRKIPIGYASNDDTAFRDNLANYFVCNIDGSDDGSVDFFAINVYEWCGYSTYSTSGYRHLTVEFSDFPVPIFFSEYGCNIVSPRPFTEVEAIYGTTMSKVFSGGIAYEYYEEVNHYGIVIEKKDGQIVKLADFDTLKFRLESAAPKGISIDQVSKPAEIVCNKPDGLWDVSFSLPHAPDEGKCECLLKSLDCIIPKDRAFDEVSFLSKICQEVDCDAISADGRLGKYGLYSDCDSRTRASLILNDFYHDANESQEVCYNGYGEVIRKDQSLGLNALFSSDGRNCYKVLNPKLLDEEKLSNVSAIPVVSTNKTKLPEEFKKEHNKKKLNATISVNSSDGERVFIHCWYCFLQAIIALVTFLI